MKKIFTSIWFWLMIIAIDLFVLDLYALIKMFSLKIFFSEVFWTAMGSIVTMLSVILAVVTYVKSREDKMKQSTYDAYDKFKNEAFELENKIYLFDLTKILESKRTIDSKLNAENLLSKEKKTHMEQWNEIKEYLTKVERIATCVNNGIFDARTIYNMGGPYMIKTYNKLIPIILYKRKSEGTDGVYEEFEKMVKKLIILDLKNKKRKQ